MNVLVAYATKHGSTAEIAEAVADALRASGLRADCVESGGVTHLGPYDAVVLGSAVYMKRWRGDARAFLRRHGKALAEMPFWVFSSGYVGDPKEDNPAWAEPPKVIKQVEQLGAREHVVFGGRIPLEPRGPIERSMVKSTPPEFRDRRDWDEIRAWATRIGAQLRPGSESRAA
jgi:menaquinone-dependent protoporphyrinogen oxidase